MKLVAVILSGGSGSRLWPLSTSKLPKPFLPIFENSNLFEKTLDRLKGLDLAKLLIITNEKYDNLHRKSLKKYSFSSYLILEKEGQNTAPAVLMAARFVEKHFGENTALLVLPADHLIENYKAFETAVNLAVKFSQKGGLITFGIKPTHPELGYGYICLNKEEESQIYLTKKFVEKPTLKKALYYLKQKNYLWNSGIFCFSVKSILAAFKKEQKKMWQHSALCLNRSLPANFSLKKSSKLLLDPKSFAGFNSISLDYAIMEKYQPVYTMKANFDWNDLGNWKAVSQAFSSDKQGNKLIGDNFSLHNQNVFLYAKKNFYGMIGLKDINIIEAGNKILLVHNDYLQEVKKIFEIDAKK